MVQIGLATETPIVHLVELLDWASGGPQPAALADLRIAPERAQVHAPAL
jgi:glycolate oxidase iron-sulfur subunit